MPRPEPVVLAVLVLATLLMPVSYRAGSDFSHPHTIFQGLVDLISGEPHHHGPAAPSPVRTSVSPFAPVTTPLSLLASTAAVDVRDVPAPDVPELLGISMPISSMSAIAALALMLATLLAGSRATPAWTVAQALRAWPPTTESPPPRTACA